MSKVTIYLPDILAQEVQAVDMNVSAVCQGALREALVSHEQGVTVGAHEYGYSQETILSEGDTILTVRLEALRLAVEVSKSEGVFEGAFITRRAAIFEEYLLKDLLEEDEEEEEEERHAAATQDAQ